MRPQTRNKAFLSAYGKGYQAGLDGKERRDCPYSDHRTYRGSTTFSRAFIHYWEDGWRDGRADRVKDVVEEDQ